MKTTHGTNSNRLCPKLWEKATSDAEDAMAPVSCVVSDLVQAFPVTPRCFQFRAVASFPERSTGAASLHRSLPGHFPTSPFLAQSGPPLASVLPRPGPLIHARAAQAGPGGHTRAAWGQEDTHPPPGAGKDTHAPPRAGREDTHARHTRASRWVRAPPAVRQAHSQRAGPS